MTARDIFWAVALGTLLVLAAADWEPAFRAWGL